MGLKAFGIYLWGILIVPPIPNSTVLLFKREIKYTIQIAADNNQEATCH